MKRIERVILLFAVCGLFAATPVCGMTLKSALPESFLKTKSNELIRGEALIPFFRKIKSNEAPVRVVHLGDSHVRGHVFPVAVRHELEAVWGSEAVEDAKITYNTPALARETGAPGLVYHAIGINGAKYADFDNETRLQQVSELNPDLIILSFGTNEAHGRNYTENWHETEMDALVQSLKQRCPEAVVMLTTPPGSYWSQRVKTVSQGRSRYVTRRVPNEHTKRVVATQLDYADRHSLPVWDLYGIVGGSPFACKNWSNAGLQRPDKIHYTPAGYTLQGRLLAEAILTAYQNYERTF